MEVSFEHVDAAISLNSSICTSVLSYYNKTSLHTSFLPPWLRRRSFPYSHGWEKNAWILIVPMVWWYKSLYQQKSGFPLYILLPRVWCSSRRNNRPYYSWYLIGSNVHWVDIPRVTFVQTTVLSVRVTDSNRTVPGTVVSCEHRTSYDRHERVVHKFVRLALFFSCFPISSHCRWIMYNASSSTFERAKWFMTLRGEESNAFNTILLWDIVKRIWPIWQS